MEDLAEIDLEALRQCGKMTLMRDLSDTHKISIRAIAEVGEALDTLVAKSKADQRIRYKTFMPKASKPGKAAVVCAVVLWLSLQEVAHQKRVVTEGLAELDRLLLLDEPGEPEGNPGTEADCESTPVMGGETLELKAKRSVNTGKKG